MKLFQVTVPPNKDQGTASFMASGSPMESVEENALWTYNKMREHDGQSPLKNMPSGTKYKEIH
jgi:hypothetical protein